MLKRLEGDFDAAEETSHAAVYPEQNGQPPSAPSAGGACARNPEREPDPESERERKRSPFYRGL